MISDNQKSDWNIIFPREEEQRRLIFSKIQRVPIADFDWITGAGGFRSRRMGKIMKKINFEMIGGEDQNSPFFKLIDLMDSKFSSASCRPWKGTSKGSLRSFLDRSKNDKFKVFIECPTGLTLEGEFSCGTSIYRVLRDSSKMYSNGYRSSFNQTKQGDVVPEFSEFYFGPVSLYDVNGTKTLVIKPKVDRDLSKIHSQHGKSPALFTSEEGKINDPLDDLYRGI